MTHSGLWFVLNQLKGGIVVASESKAELKHRIRELEEQLAEAKKKNPPKKGGISVARESQAELKRRIRELEEELEEANDKLDTIAELVTTEEEETDDSQRNNYEDYQDEE